MLESKEFAAYSNGQVIDEGLRNFMLKIYNYMAGGLCCYGFGRLYNCQQHLIVAPVF